MAQAQLGEEMAEPAKTDPKATVSFHEFALEQIQTVHFWYENMFPTAEVKRPNSAFARSYGRSSKRN